jgi:hypothetical protein
MALEDATTRDVTDDVGISVYAEITSPTYDGSTELDEIDVYGSDGFYGAIYGGEGVDLSGTVWDTQEDSTYEEVDYSVIASGFREQCPVNGSNSGSVAPAAPRPIGQRVASESGGSNDCPFCSTDTWMTTRTYQLVSQWPSTDATDVVTELRSFASEE